VGRVFDPSGEGRGIEPPVGSSPRLKNGTKSLVSIHHLSPGTGLKLAVSV